MTDRLKERLRNIGDAARERHNSCEESTAALVGIAREFETTNDPERVQALAAYALSHLAVQIGNIASALNEAAAAQQELAAYTQESYRLEMAELELTKASVNLSGRGFIGKKQ